MLPDREILGSAAPPELPRRQPRDRPSNPSGNRNPCPKSRCRSRGSSHRPVTAESPGERKQWTTSGARVASHSAIPPTGGRRNAAASLRDGPSSRSSAPPFSPGEAKTGTAPRRAGVSRGLQTSLPRTDFRAMAPAAEPARAMASARSEPKFPVVQSSRAGNQMPTATALEIARSGRQAPKIALAPRIIATVTPVSSHPALESTSAIRIPAAHARRKDQPRRLR